MIPNLHIVAMNTLTWVTGTLIGGATMVSQISYSEHEWLPIIIQAGMTSVVAILLLKTAPMLIKAQAEQNKSFTDALESQRKEHVQAMERMLTLASKENRDVIEKMSDAHSKEMQNMLTMLAKNKDG